MAPDSPAAAPAAQDSSAKAAQKVELDLDDAPFLEEAEEEKQDSPPPDEGKSSAADSAETPAQQEKPKALTLKERLLAHKLKLIIAGGSLVFFLGVVIGLKFFLSGSPAEKAPPPPPKAEPITIVIPDKPPPLPEAPAPRFTFSWDPFWVPRKDDEGAIRFLVAKFSVPTDNPQLFAEMQSKKIVLRDAIFYYLGNRSFITLSDKEKADTLKAEIMTVINEHVGSGKVENIYIESFLIK